MDDMWVVGVFVTIFVPMLISIIALWMQWKKDNKEDHKEYVEVTTKLTAAMVKLTDKIDVLFCDNERQDIRLDNLEQRTSTLEHDVTVLQNDMHHYHEEKGRA